MQFKMFTQKKKVAKDNKQDTDPNSLLNSSERSISFRKYFSGIFVMLMALLLHLPDMLSAQGMLPLPPHSSLYSGSARGFWFEAPKDFNITGLRVPASAGTGDQALHVVKITEPNWPVSFTNQSTNFTTLFYTNTGPNGNIIDVDIDIEQGELYGIFGTAGTGNSYGNGSYMSEVDGVPVELHRFGYQGHINVNPAPEIWGATSGSITRVEVYYQVSFGLDIMAGGIDYPATFSPGTQNLGVQVNIGGEERVGSFDVGYQLDNDPPVVISSYQPADSLDPDDTYVVDFTGANALNLPAAGSYDLTIWTAAPNGIQPDSVPSNDTMHLQICTADEGLWIIDRSGGGDFTSFGDAFEYFSNCGFSGDVTFQVEPGEYEDEIYVEELPGIGPGATLTVEGNGDSPEDVRLYGESDRTLGFENVSHITIRNMTIESETDGAEQEALYFDNSNNITLENMILKRDVSDNNDRYVFKADNAHSISISNSQITGGGAAIYVRGAGAGPHNISITGNTITDPGFRGIHLEDLEGTIVNNNSINLSSGGDNNALGIYLLQSKESEITRNVLRNNGSSGIALIGENQGETSRTLIANNMIAAGFRSSSSVGGGIYSDMSWNLDIYHNSIHQDNAGANVFRITANGTPEGFRIKNNIFFYSGGSTGRNVIDDPGALVELDYNVYYSTGSSFYDFDGTVYNDFNSYQSAVSHDANSYFLNPAFNGASDLRIANIDQVRYGDPTTGVTDDFFGSDRDPAQPVIGAHEVVLYDLSISGLYRPTEAVECGSSAEPLYVIIENMALQPLTNFNLSADISGDFTAQLTHNYQSSLPSYSAPDTVLIGTFDSRFGGSVDIHITHDVPDDANASNDELLVNREFLESPYDFVINNDTVCGSTTPVMLTANSPQGEITWYSSFSGGLELASGDTFTTTPLLGTTTYFLEAEHDVTGCVNDVREPISVVSLRLPSVGFAESVDFDGVLQAGSSSNPDVAFYGGSVEYELLPLHGLTNNSYGSDWEITGYTLENNGTPATNFRFTAPAGGQAGYIEFEPATSEVDETFMLTLDLENYQTGCIGETVRYITVIDGPVALFDYDEDVCLGGTVTFDNQSSIGSNETLSYEWNLGDGTIINTTDDAPFDHTYTDAGTYNVTLHVTASGGTEASLTETVEVHPVPEAHFEATDEVCAGVDVAFTNATDEHDADVTYHWDFGDGNSSTDESPVHIYSTGGNYTVVLTAETAEGCVDQYQTEVDIYTLPSPSAVAVEEVCAGEAITFSSENRNPSRTYSWDFGDGNQGSGMDVNHVYTESGTFTIIHTVTTSNGCEADTDLEVTVHPEPSAGFEVAINENQEWAFTPEEEGLTSYQWYFGDADGSSSTEESPVFIYTTNGYYEVTLITANEFGCSNEHTENVEVLSASIADLPAGIEVTAYPNPFREVLNVAFALEQQEEITITLYDLLGRRISELASGSYEAGSHEVDIDARANQLSEGAYLLEITTSEGRFHKHVQYLR